MRLKVKTKHEQFKPQIIKNKVQHKFSIYFKLDLPNTHWFTRDFFWDQRGKEPNGFGSHDQIYCTFLVI